MRRFTYLLLCLFLTYNASAQVGINTDNSDPDASAMLDVKSTNKGVLIPRMSSTDRQQILEPAVGLMVYDFTAQAFYYFNGVGWLELLSGSVAVLSDEDNDTKVDVTEIGDEDRISFTVGGTERLLMQNSLFRINGRLNINNAFSFPVMDGTNGQVLQTDGIGNLNWVTSSGIVNQDLSLSNHILSLTNDASTVDLSIYDNDQTTVVQDADNDTKIQVEESADEDMIRFDIAGEETWRMNGTRLEPSNEGKGIFIGESAGANDSLLTESSPGNFISTSNIFLGYKSGEQSGTGLYNIGIGEETLNLGDSMLANIGIGYQSLSNTHLSVGNVGIGLRSLYKLEDGEVNIALGYNAVSNLTKGNGNVAIGALTMGIAKEGNRNVALGYEAMGENLELENNVAIGYRAGYGDDNTVSTTNNVWVGNKAGFYSEGSGNVFLGSSVGASYSWRKFQ